MVKKALLAAVLSMNIPLGQPALAQADLSTSYCSETSELTPEILGELYLSAYLKIGRRLSLENLRTVEDYAATLSFRLNDDVLEKFQRAFVRFGHPASFTNFIKNLRNSEHWKTETRFDNSSVMMTALLSQTLGELDLSEAEIATLWLSQLDEEAQLEASLSVKLANLSGAFGDKRPLMDQEFSLLISSLKNSECLSQKSELPQTISNLFWSRLTNMSRQKAIEIPTLEFPDQKLIKGDSIDIRYKIDEAPFLYKTYRLQRDKINKMSDFEVIQTFHQYFGDQDYLVVEKKAGKASYFSRENHLLQTFEVQTYPGDEINAGGAGIYFYSGKNRDHHYVQALKDQNVRLAFRGQVSVPKKTLVYILPETPRHRFRIKNRTLTFNSAQVYRPRVAFNHAGFNTAGRDSKFETYLKDPQAQEFVAALQDEKSRLMNLLSLDNDDYNLLAEFSYGVLSPETDYGNSLKYKLKETVPALVAILKGKGLDTSFNSRGLTQIKRIPKTVVSEYEIDKADLNEARYSAVVTLAFSADLLRELRNMSYQNPSINEENIQDYLYYLYNGKHSEIRNNTATPEKNISIRKIKSAIAHLFIEE